MKFLRLIRQRFSIQTYKVIKIITNFAKNQKNMKGEGKGLTDFALMFAAGSWAGLHIGPQKEIIHTVTAVSFLAAVAAGLFPAVLSGNRYRLHAGEFLQPLFLNLSFFFAGIYSASVFLMAGNIPCSPENRPFLQKTAEISVLKLKEEILDIPFRHEESNAMILALVTGDRALLPRHVSEAFRISGASHILALSGMHLGVIYIILTRMFSVIGNSPKALWFRSMMVTGVSGYYTVMTGAGASIVRAFLFIALNETAKCTGRKRPPMNIFSTGLMIQAAMSPEVLESVGFQLSYLAMAGIYLLYPKMKDWYKEPFPPGKGRAAGKLFKTSPMKKLWDTAAMSISCQLFTAPAVWYHFGSFPPYFLITNLIAIPLSTVAINLSIPVIILHRAGICPDILIRADDLAIQAMCRSLEIISGL